MAEAKTLSLEEMLEGEISRQNFGEVRAKVLAAFSSFRFAEHAAAEMRDAMNQAGGQQQKQLAARVGVLYTVLGRFDQAVEALKLAEDNADTRYLTARCLVGLGRCEEAIKLLKKCPAGDQEAQELLAEQLLVNGHADQARAQMADRGLDKGDTAPSCYLLGRLAETEGAYDVAMDLYKKAMGLDASYLPAIFRLAYNYDINGQDEQAIELYEKCASLSPTDVSALVNLGLLYEDQELYYEAIECYKRVLAADGNNTRARLYLKDAESSLNMWVDEEELKKLKLEDEVLRIPVTDFELSVRSRNCLEKMGITTLGDLTRVTEQELLAFKNFGETSLTEIREMLETRGLRLGMALEEAGTAHAAKPAQKDATTKLSMPVSELDVSTRCRRCMERLQVATLGDLIKLTEQELLAMPNFGRTSVNEIKQKLAEMGLELQKK